MGIDYKHRDYCRDEEDTSFMKIEESEGKLGVTANRFADLV